jgi:hypothetical protein
VSVDGNAVVVRGLDCIDGTPLADLKSEARAGLGLGLVLVTDPGRGENGSQQGIKALIAGPGIDRGFQATVDQEHRKAVLSTPLVDGLCGML